MNSVLVVTDEESIVNQVRELLSDHPFDVLAAGNEYAVIRRCLTTKPDFVIVDVEMPGGTGFESISTVRRYAKSSVIVGITRDRHEDLWIKVAEACGADGYVRGPLTMRSLVSAMKDRDIKAARWLA